VSVGFLELLGFGFLGFGFLGFGFLGFGFLLGFELDFDDALDDILLPFELFLSLLALYIWVAFSSSSSSIHMPSSENDMDLSLTT